MHSLMNHDDSNSGAANTTKDAVLATEATVPETSTVLVPNLENPDGDTPSDITEKPENEDRCGAQSKTTGKPCRNVAGKGTCHRGQGRCRFHGGSSRTKNRLFSTIAWTRLGKRMEELAEAPDLQRRAAKVAMLMAMLEDKVGEYQKCADELQAWHRAESAAYQRLLKARSSADLVQAVRELREAEPSRAAELPNPTQIASLADTISRMEERYHRMARICSSEELQRILQLLGAVVAEHVADEKIKEKIRAGWA